MKSIIERYKKIAKVNSLKEKLDNKEHYQRQTDALIDVLSNIYGEEKLAERAKELDVINDIHSQDICVKVAALHSLVFGEKKDELPDLKEIPRYVDDIEEEIADILAKRSVEIRIERRIADKLQKKHEDYIKEIRKQVIKEESGCESPETLRKYAQLEKLETKSLSRSVLEVLRPSSLSEIIGQDEAIRALISKIASPYPQHVIIYGPPGVGKTTAARLVLEESKKIPYTPFGVDAKFVEVDGATLRWDPREVTNPLLGSVHDPIYQGARRDLADGSIPEPKTGLVTEAHGGVLFIDEIGEMDIMLQNKLLKVLEDKRVYFDSSYYDPGAANIPKYIKKLFRDGAPADFILIAATTRPPSGINPALRSRCAEIFFKPLYPEEIKQIVEQAAKKLNVILEQGAAEFISQYTIEGRKAVNILVDAYGLVRYNMLNNGLNNGEDVNKPLRITQKDLKDVIQVSRLNQCYSLKASNSWEVGRIFGLGVIGFIGSLIEFESVAFPAVKKGSGSIRFNDTAGSMARDSLFNAATVARRLIGTRFNDYDIHVNTVGGGNIDGPSAGVAILLSILSALKGIPIQQNLAVTGEISIQGKIKPVGGIFEKIFSAKQAGIKRVIIPRDNLKDLPSDLRDIEIIPISDVFEAADLVLQSLLSETS
ncbi:MAG: ATP-dependent Lon protease [Thermosediminibacterales bacterium]|nr:ATP-dependent Lon protease [Thermosediminibacterales bacterium]MDK2836414.1 ATP-dependent Lon protease [Thermosediminibacterales bacterium]